MEPSARCSRNQTQIPAPKPKTFLINLSINSTMDHRKLCWKCVGVTKRRIVSYRILWKHLGHRDVSGSVSVSSISSCPSGGESEPEKEEPDSSFSQSVKSCLFLFNCSIPLEDKG